DWPGRLQLITRPSGQKVLLDGAHNVAGARTLRAALEQEFPATRPAVILGILGDKNWPVICETIAPLADKLFLTPVASQRTADPAALQQACRQAHPSAEAVVCASLAEALARTSEEPFVVVTGSLYLVGEALELLHAAQAHLHTER